MNKRMAPRRFRLGNRDLDAPRFRHPWPVSGFELWRWHWKHRTP